MGWVKTKESLFTEEKLNLLVQEPPKNPLRLYRFRVQQKKQAQEYIKNLIHLVKEEGPKGKEVLEHGLRFLFDEISKGSSWSVLYEVCDTFSELYREFPVSKRIVLNLLEEHNRSGNLDDKTFKEIKKVLGV